MNAPDCICSPGRLPLGAFCAGRDDLEREALHDDRISIRAPRAGRDFLRLQDIARALISIHAPRVGRDVISRKSRPQESRFQSTRPVWGATTNGVNLCMTSKISIHAPRVGRDNRSIQGCHQGQTFQSTRPVWGATFTGEYDVPTVKDFNPRAPCGARHNRTVVRRVPEYFNPRAPCGARP